MQQRRRAPARIRRRRELVPTCENRRPANPRARCLSAAARESGASIASAPQAPSTWNHKFLARARSASASRSSIAPVSTVPAVPTRRKGVKPARRSASMAARKAVKVDAIAAIHGDPAQRIASDARDIQRPARCSHEPPPKRTPSAACRLPRRPHSASQNPAPYRAPPKRR